MIYPYPYEIRCPNCAGRIDWTLPSLGRMFTALTVWELAAWVAVASLVALGVAWPAAWVFALVLGVVLLVNRGWNQQSYVCAKCLREFTYTEIYRSRG